LGDQYEHDTYGFASRCRLLSGDFSVPTQPTGRPSTVATVHQTTSPTIRRKSSSISSKPAITATSMLLRAQSRERR
jgi:hypothetical protein